MTGRRTGDPMTTQARLDRASWLAAVAVLGLVVTPLLHAEEHRREGISAEQEALVEAWQAGSTDPLDQLAFALEHVHASQPPRQEHGHGHSHGPSSPGPHGAGALAHLNIALHAAPQFPDLPVAVPGHAAPVPFVGQLRSALRYLVPEWSQGPPAGS